MSDTKIIEKSDKTTELQGQDPRLPTENPTDIPAHSASKKNIMQEKRSFTDRWKYNRFWLIRASYHVLRTIWIIVMAIGAFIAWLISLLFI